MVIETLAAAIAVTGAAYGAWRRFLKPRTVKYRLRRLYQLVEAWFDEVDTHIESGYSEARASNLEAKVRAYIKDHGLEHYGLRLTPKFRRRFLKMCGIKRELRDDWGLFARYSRCNVDGMPLGLWWTGVVGAFYRFHSNYVSERPETNWVDVEMQVKFLKMYAGAKTE